jgi:hypothetical protein
MASTAPTTTPLFDAACYNVFCLPGWLANCQMKGPCIFGIKSRFPWRSNALVAFVKGGNWYVVGLGRNGVSSDELDVELEWMEPQPEVAEP